jgi:protein-disulfide isomerase
VSKNTTNKGSKRKVVIFTSLGVAIMLLVMVAIIAAWSDKEEEFPTFTDVSDEINVAVGDFKLEKQANIGDPNAPVKVFQFVDYKCPYCKAWNNDNFGKFKEEYIETGKVQLYIINFSFIGPDSIKAAMVGEILWKQSPEAFWEFQDAIYKHQGDKDTIWANEKYLLDLIEDYVPHGDAAAVKKSLRKHEGLFEVKEDFAITTTNGVDSVPTFLVNGQRYINPTLSDFTKVIDSALAAVD